MTPTEIFLTATEAKKTGKTFTSVSVGERETIDEAPDLVIARIEYIISWAKKVHNQEYSATSFSNPQNN